jgi:hypothetical protein
VTDYGPDGSRGEEEKPAHGYIATANLPKAKAGWPGRAWPPIPDLGFAARAKGHLRHAVQSIHLDRFIPKTLVETRQRLPSSLTRHIPVYNSPRIPAHRVASPCADNILQPPATKTPHPGEHTNRRNHVRAKVVGSFCCMIAWPLSVAISYG